jgi:hypothetical protein
MIKALKKLGIEGKYLNIIKLIYDKLRTNIMLNGENQTISSKVRSKTRVFTFPTFVQYSA